MEIWVCGQLKGRLSGEMVQHILLTRRPKLGSWHLYWAAPEHQVPFQSTCTHTSTYLLTCTKLKIQRIFKSSFKTNKGITIEKAVLGNGRGKARSQESSTLVTGQAEAYGAGQEMVPRETRQREAEQEQGCTQPATAVGASYICTRGPAQKEQAAPLLMMSAGFASAYCRHSAVSLPRESVYPREPGNRLLVRQGCLLDTSVINFQDLH